MPQPENTLADHKAKLPIEGQILRGGFTGDAWICTRCYCADAGGWRWLETRSGVLALLVAERDNALRAVVNFAGAGGAGKARRVCARGSLPLSAA